MNHPPVIQTSFDALPSDPSARHEFLVDIFGRYLFWALEEAVSKSKTLLESPDARTKLGRIIAEPYLQAATKLNQEQQGIAIDLARQTAGTFAKNVLLMLQAQGITFRLGEDHAIQFRLTSEIRDVENMEVKFEEVINRGGKKAFADYWGRWLNQNSSKNDQV